MRRSGLPLLALPGTHDDRLVAEVVDVADAFEVVCVVTGQLQHR
jgi:hypothetical protein